MVDAPEHPDRLPVGRNGPAQGLLLGSLGLLALGAVMVYSSSVGDPAAAELMARREVKHLLLAAAAAAVMLCGAAVDYRWLLGGRGWAARGLLIVTAGLCVAVLIPGVGLKTNGAYRWLPLPGTKLTFQPSELLKMALVLWLAWRLGDTRHTRHTENTRGARHADSPRRVDTPAGFLVPAAVIVGCSALVAKEDLGTGAIMAATGMAMLFMGGARLTHLLGLALPAAGGFTLLLLSSPARMRRIMVFLDPWNGAPDHTWQLRQALIAVGSGGLFGKGLGAGSAKLGFLPESQNDFIFALICEELGLIGAAMLIALIALAALMFWRTAARCADGRGRLLAAGMGLLFVGQAVLHIAVNIGAAPPTGVALPLVGAGGTALLLTGLLMASAVSVATFGGRRGA